jgi:trehalose synthase
MTDLLNVPLSTLPPERFSTALNPDQFETFKEAIEKSRQLFEGRVVWNVNSTDKGGGVVEMLRPLLGYARGAGVDARWVVIPGNPDFFKVTKRIHNHLHGSTGDGGELGEAEHEIYEAALADSGRQLAELVKPEDIVILHDPQTAGLTKFLKDVGVPIVWRCHVGLDMPNDVSRGAWDFLIPYVKEADFYVFSREAFEWEGLEKDKMVIIAPSIDAFSPKNQELDEDTVTAILNAAGLGADGTGAEPKFEREDGSPGLVERKAEVDEEQPLEKGTRFVLQVSRWDRLKDPLGVIQGFVDHVAPAVEDAHLVYAGPSVAAVADDPEGAEVLKEAQDLWKSLPDDVRRRVHLVALPMDDTEENAAIVNALQRRADVVVQKSIAEGFGLTVAEAMWKARPVVATRIGGIQDQIASGKSGLLIDDPRDLAAYGNAVRELLENPDDARKMGQAAQDRVRGQFLGARSLLQYLEVFRKLMR